MSIPSTLLSYTIFQIKETRKNGSVQLLSHVRLFATPWATSRQASLSITNSQSLPNHCPLSQWCHPAISSSAVPFTSRPYSFPASGYMYIYGWVSSLFTWNCQNTANWLYPSAKYFWCLKEKKRNEDSLEKSKAGIEKAKTNVEHFGGLKVKNW